VGVGAEDNKNFVAFVASEHGQRLRRFLQRRLPNPTDAHDLAQEVYLRLLRVKRDNQEIRNPEAYLLTVASHLVHEHAVRQAAYPPLLNLDDPLANMRASADEAPDANADREQRMDALERALGRVSEKAATVLLLHRRDGFTLDEIAKRLGFSRSMAKKYLVIALAQCRRQLDRMSRE
jgi:RNA polymerase sigma factor (sigma-70 family)